MFVDFSLDFPTYLPRNEQVSTSGAGNELRSKRDGGGETGGTFFFLTLFFVSSNVFSADGPPSRCRKNMQGDDGQMHNKWENIILWLFFLFWVQKKHSSFL